MGELLLNFGSHLGAVWEKGRVVRRKNAQESVAGIFEELDCKRGRTRVGALAALEETQKRILRGWLRGRLLCR